MSYRGRCLRLGGAAFLSAVAVFIIMNRRQFRPSIVCPKQEPMAPIRERVRQAKQQAEEIGKLEFPKMYNVLPCDPKVNKTIKEDVCKIIGAIIDEGERQTYLRLLTYFDGLAFKHNWTYFLDYGTLLGSWRHHGFVPYDQDVDLYIDYKHRKDIINIVEEQSRYIPKQMVTDQLKIYDSERIVGGAYYPNVGRWWAPDLDCWFFKDNGTHIFKSDEPASDVWKKTDVFPLKKRPFEGMNLPTPRDTLGHLVYHFGNTSTCHRYASGYKPVECKELKEYFPFVQRAFKNGRMEEKLVLGNKVLQVRMLDEPKSSLTVNQFTLQRKRL